VVVHQINVERVTVNKAENDRRCAGYCNAQTTDRTERTMFREYSNVFSAQVVAGRWPAIWQATSLPLQFF